MVWWKLRYRFARSAPKTGKFLVLTLAVGFNVYLLHYWALHSGLNYRLSRWKHHWSHPPASRSVELANPYLKAFEHCMTRLRADRRVRLFAYEYPAQALRYQLASNDGGWRLQARLPWLSGLAIARTFRSILDEEGIIYIDPSVIPMAALENPHTPHTPMKAETLRQYFLLVPNLEGSRHANYRLVPARLLGSRHPSTFPKLTR